MLTLAAACSPPVHLDRAGELRATDPPRIETVDGALTAQQSHTILEALSREPGTSTMLLHHIAFEETVTDSPLVMGNRVTLLRDGPEAYPAMERTIAAARHHVNLEVYTFRDDAVGRRIADLLIAKARSGVGVNVIYDSVGCLGTDRSFFDEMRAAGVRVVEYDPVDPARARGRWQVEQRDHRKLIVIDDRIAFTGGINISTEYSGSSWSSGGLRRSSSTSNGPKPEPPWRDTHVEIEGPVVAHFQELFRDTWQKQHGPPVAWEKYFEPAPVAGNQIVRAIGTTPDHAGSLIHTTLLSAIEHAERSVHLTQMYFVPDDALVSAIERAARRGVDTRIILPGTGFWMTRYAGRAHFSDLLAAGVHVYERNGSLLHAKTVVIDGVWSTVGSANLDYRSFVKNDEVNAVILGEDFGNQLEAMFRDDIADSKEITRQQWKRRGISTRLKETAARAWKRWL